MDLNGAAGTQGPGFEIHLLAPLSQSVSRQPRGLGLLAAEGGSGSPVLPAAPPYNNAKPAGLNWGHSRAANAQTTAPPSPPPSGCVDKVGTRRPRSCQEAWKVKCGLFPRRPWVFTSHVLRLSSSLLMARRQSGPWEPTSRPRARLGPTPCVGLRALLRIEPSRVSDNVVLLTETGLSGRERKARTVPTVLEVSQGPPLSFLSIPVRR